MHGKGLFFPKFSYFVFAVRRQMKNEVPSTLKKECFETVE